MHRKWINKISCTNRWCTSLGQIANSINFLFVHETLQVSNVSHFGLNIYKISKGAKRVPCPMQRAKCPGNWSKIPKSKNVDKYI